MGYLVFSLMLLLSGAIITLGSPIKDDDTEIEALLSDAGLRNFPEMVPNRKDLEALLMRSNQSNPLMEKHTEMSLYRQEANELLARGTKTKRVEPATVIAGVTLGVVVLQSVLDALGDVSRKVAIGIDNESGYKWTALNVYFYSGTSDRVMPHDVDSGEALLYGARKTSYSVKGAVGVMTYYIPKIHSTLSVMFSIPYDYTWYSNWWNVELNYGKHKADYNMYYGMYYGEGVKGDILYYEDPIKGDHHWHSKNLGQGLYARGAMSDSSKTTLEIHVKKS